MFTQEQWMDTLKALQKKNDKKSFLNSTYSTTILVPSHQFKQSTINNYKSIKKSSTILSIRINISFKYLNWIKKGLTALPPQSHISTVSDSIFSFTSVPRSIDSKFLTNK